MTVTDSYLDLYQQHVRPLEEALAARQEALVSWPTAHGSDLLQEARDTLEIAQHDLFGAFCDELIERYADGDFPTALIDYLYSGDHDIAHPESWRAIERRASLFASPAGQGIEPTDHHPSP